MKIILYKNSGMLRSVLLLCAVPYLGMLVYLALGLHKMEGQMYHAPGPFMLLCLAVLGGVVPATVIVLILRNLLHNNKHFELNGILEAYVSLIIIFASWYSLLQVQGVEPAFNGMQMMWTEDTGLEIGAHIAHLHSIYLDSLYLSIMTITTVGFGDIVPLTVLGKLLTAVEGVIGVGFLGVVLGHYFSVCIHKKGDLNE